MTLFADPRARAVLPVPTGFHLLDEDQKVIASAYKYSDYGIREPGRSEWWGISSHRSSIPIRHRADSMEEAKRILTSTVWLYKPGTGRDEFEYFAERAKHGVLYIRSLTDDEVLEAARDDYSTAFQMIQEWMGPVTNRSWITFQCAEEAYLRDIMTPEEMDWITR